MVVSKCLTEPLTHRYLTKEHIRNNVIKPQTNKRKRRPPDRHHLAKVFPGHHGKKASQAHKPVGTNASEEDHVPFGRYDFGVGEGLDFSAVHGEVEDSSVADDDAHHEQGTGEVAPEGYKPVQKHLKWGDAAVEAGDCCELG